MSAGWSYKDSWNNRPIEDALRAENDRLKEALQKIINLQNNYPSHATIISIAKIAEQALRGEK
jgi:DNA-binding MurR/RpiR family transcriptional regulator